MRFLKLVAGYEKLDRNRNVEDLDIFSLNQRTDDYRNKEKNHIERILTKKGISRILTECYKKNICSGFQSKEKVKVIVLFFFQFVD